MEAAVPWLRIDETLHSHPKFLSVGVRGIGLFVAGLCYAKDKNKPLLTHHDLRQFTDESDEVVQSLVRAKLWTRCLSGYRIHQPDTLRKWWAFPDPEARRRYRQARRAARRHAAGSLSVGEWEEIQKQFHQRCAYCQRRRELTQDHVVPLSRGGRHDRTNIVPACRSCNSRKHTKSLKDFDYHHRRAF